MQFNILVLQRTVWTFPILLGSPMGQLIVEDGLYLFLWAVIYKVSNEKAITNFLLTPLVLLSLCLILHLSVHPSMITSAHNQRLSNFQLHNKCPKPTPMLFYRIIYVLTNLKMSHHLLILLVKQLQLETFLILCLGFTFENNRRLI